MAEGGQLRRATTTDAEGRFEFLELPAAPSTDDRGEFRAYGLMPGEYVIQATSRSLGGISVANPNDAGEGFAPTYYPGTISSAEAQAVRVGVGEEVAAQFSMIPSRLARITGTVVDSEGRAAAGARLSIVTVTGNGMTSYSNGTVAANGTFAISGVAPGEHSLRVQQSRAGTAGEFASIPLVVANTDPRANGTLEDDGSFTLAGASGRVFFNVPAPSGWMVKSVTLDGDDITDVPLDLTGRASIADLRIVLTDKPTNVSGQVTNARGEALRDYVVVIQPVERKEPVIASRLVRTARPDTTGTFQTRGMRPRAIRGHGGPGARSGPAVRPGVPGPAAREGQVLCGVGRRQRHAGAGVDRGAVGAKAPTSTIMSGT